MSLELAELDAARVHRLDPHRHGSAASGFGERAPRGLAGDRLSELLGALGGLIVDPVLRHAVADARQRCRRGSNDPRGRDERISCIVWQRLDQRFVILGKLEAGLQRRGQFRRKRVAGIGARATVGR